MSENNNQKTKNFYYYYSLIFPFILLLFLLVMLSIYFIHSSLIWQYQTPSNKTFGNAVAIISALRVYKNEYNSYPPGQFYTGYVPNNLTTPISYTIMYNDPYHIPKVYNTFLSINKFLFQITGIIYLICLLILLTLEMISKKDLFKKTKWLSALLFSIVTVLIFIGFSFRIAYPGVVAFKSGFVLFLILAFVMSIILRNIYGEKIEHSIFGGKIYLMCTIIFIIPIAFFILRPITLNNLMKKPEYNKTFYYHTDGKDYYTLTSFGPDLDLDIPIDSFESLNINPEMTYTEVWDYFIPYEYDATNGLISNGDVTKLIANNLKEE